MGYMPLGMSANKHIDKLILSKMPLRTIHCLLECYLHEPNSQNNSAMFISTLAQPGEVIKFLKFIVN